jgi:uncharacterized protein YggE
VVRRVSSVPGGPAPRGGAVEPMAARTALPVEAGTTAVTATVRVRFELR